MVLSVPDIPTLLVIAGILFIFVAIVRNISGYLEASIDQKTAKILGMVGIIFFTLGLITAAIGIFSPTETTPTLTSASEGGEGIAIHTPTPTPLITLTPTPTPLITLTPTPTPLITPTPTPTPLITPTPTPTPTPIQMPTLAISSIAVSSSPLGASIYLDGKYQGETPKILKNIEPDSYLISLKLTGHEDWSQIIHVDTDKTTSISPSLIPFPTHTPSAEIKDIWVEYNAWEYYLDGMKIHVSFDINNLKGKDCIAIAYFYFENGEPLFDFNQQYCTTDGEVASWTNFVPEYEYTDFTDLSIFLPYDELHMEPDTYDLKFYVSILYEDRELYQSDWEYFSFTQW